MKPMLQLVGDFPILSRPLGGGRRLAYLDNAATSQKPRQVLDALNEYYERYNANVHRGTYLIADSDGTAGFSSTTDLVINITGYTGTLEAANFLL